MKKCLFALSMALLMVSCAGVRVTKTYVATGASDPQSIYIRPFQIEYAEFHGTPGKSGEWPIEKSLVPKQFADDLQEELCKIAPARVLESDEVPTVGWLVEGEFEVVDAGNPSQRGVFGSKSGQSSVLIHVRVIEVGRHGAVAEAKDSKRVTQTKLGRVIYEFDLAGGSNGTGALGSIYAPGLGNAIPFDLRNAAERVMMVLSSDPHRYGFRVSPTIR